jgi:GT2 family glycosyltransferase
MNKKIYDDLTIVFLLYEEKLSLIINCLENIKDFKIIIVDNAGNKRIKKQIEKRFNIHKYILNKKNLGCAVGFNQLINLSETEYLLFCQVDCKIFPKDIFLLMEKYMFYQDCFLVSPSYCDKDKKIIENGGILPENKSSDGIIQLEGDMCVEKIITAVFLSKRKDLINIGRFDEKFFLYFLDYDLCRKISKKKKSIIQIFDIKIEHNHGISKVRNLIKKTFLRTFNFTFDELYYFYKINQHQEIYYNLEKKVYNYVIKFFICTLLLKVEKSTFYFSKILAYYKFNYFLKSKLK